MFNCGEDRPILPKQVYGVWAGGDLGPSDPTQKPGKRGLKENFEIVKNSGLNLISFSLCHLGRGSGVKCNGQQTGCDPKSDQDTGDIIFNTTTLIKEGVANQKATEWATQIEKLYKSGNWYLSWCFGGAPFVYDFEVIAENFIDSKTKTILPSSTLYKNMKVLYDTFPYVRCINLDNEEIAATTPVVLAFAIMCADIGFDISASPNSYTYQCNWLTIVQKINGRPNADKKGRMTHLTLQGQGGIDLNLNMPVHNSEVGTFTWKDLVSVGVPPNKDPLKLIWGVGSLWNQDKTNPLCTRDSSFPEGGQCPYKGLRPLTCCTEFITQLKNLNNKSNCKNQDDSLANCPPIIGSIVWMYNSGDVKTWVNAMKSAIPPSPPSPCPPTPGPPTPGPPTPGVGPPTPGPPTPGPPTPGPPTPGPPTPGPPTPTSPTVCSDNTNQVACMGDNIIGGCTWNLWGTNPSAGYCTPTAPSPPSSPPTPGPPSPYSPSKNKTALILSSISIVLVILIFFILLLQFYNY